MTNRLQHERVIKTVRMILLCGGLGLQTATATPGTCEKLVQLMLPHGSVTKAESVDKTDTLPAFCRVAATLKPSADSDIKMEAWLPVAGWNGKFEAVGNGG